MADEIRGTYKWGLGGQSNDTNREDLINTYTQQSPSDVPMLAQMPKTTASSILHQWLVETLRAPRTTGAIEGGAYNITATSTTPARVVNVCMIWREDIGVSRSQMKANPAAIGDTYLHEEDKAVAQIGTDIESCIWASLTSATGATGTSRLMKGLQNFIATNTARPASLGAAATAGQLAANDLGGLLQLVYSAGGNPDQIWASPAVKRILSNFTYPSQNRNIAATERTLVQGVDTFLTDFGPMAVILDRWVPQATNATTAASGAADVSGVLFVLKRSNNRFAWYDPVHHDYMGRLGDSVNGIVVGEGTLEVLNEKTNGLIKAVNNKSALLGDA